MSKPKKTWLDELGRHPKSLDEIPCPHCHAYGTVGHDGSENGPGRATWYTYFVCGRCRGRYWVLWSIEGGRQSVRLEAGLGERRRAAGGGAVDASP